MSVSGSFNLSCVVAAPLLAVAGPVTLVIWWSSPDASVAAILVPACFVLCAVALSYWGIRGAAGTGTVHAWAVTGMAMSLIAVGLLLFPVLGLIMYEMSGGE